MPYKNISELPEQTKVLPKAAQTLFMHRVNEQLEAGKDESAAFKIAWGIVERDYEKKDGKWVAKMEEGRFMVPFADLAEDKWYLYFPFREIYHQGYKKDFTINDGIEMVSNFKNSVPDYELPIDTLHKDELGIYGHIADLRIEADRVEWKPSFRDGALEEFAKKGYKYASPEVCWEDYTGVYDGKTYNNVALGIAITPRPRLGRGTAIFEDGNIVNYEDTEDGQQQLTEELVRLATTRPELKARIEKLFADMEPKQVEEKTMPEKEIKDMGNLADVAAAEKYAEAIAQKDAEIAALQEAQVKATDELKQYAEQVRLAEEAVAQERLEKRKLQFAETAQELKLSEDYGDELMWLNDADGSDNKDHYGKFIATIKALQSQVDTAALFSEKGHDGQDRADPASKLEQLAREMAQEKSIPYAQALVKVNEQNADLYREYSAKVSKEK